MKMPSILITFTEAAKTAISRGERGIVGIVMKDALAETESSFEVQQLADIPEGLEAENKEEIKRILIGYKNAPKKVVVYLIPTEATDYEEALKFFEITKVTYLVVQHATTDGVAETVAEWVKSQRNDNDYRVKAVLPNVAANSEGVINYTTENARVGEKVYTAEQYCGRIAGLIAGTPLNISCTYAPLEELTDCTRLTRKEMDEAIEAGKFIIFHDGEKVKVGRGINSKTTNDAATEQTKKIKIVEIMDMIHDDLKKTIEDQYIGKFANSYDNKIILLSAIKAYFEQLKGEQLISSYSVEIDIEANKKYLQDIGKATAEMADDELKKADTGDKVFISAAVAILDAIEEVTMPISI